MWTNEEGNFDQLINFPIKFTLLIEKQVLAPTLLSVRKKASTNDIEQSEEMPIGDDEPEDPIDTNLEQDEAEAEQETQRK